MSDNGSSNGAAKKEPWHWGSMLAAIIISVVSATIIQFAVAIRWSGTIEERLTNLDSHHRELDATISRFDLQGTRGVPVLQEKISAIEKQNDTENTRINNISTRLDSFIQQVNRLDTPLSQKVLGLEGITVTLRDSLSVQTATTNERLRQLNEAVARLQVVDDQNITRINELEKKSATILDYLRQTPRP